MNIDQRIQQLHQNIISLRFQDAAKVLSLCKELSSLADEANNVHFKAESLYYECDAYISLTQYDQAFECGKKGVQYMKLHHKDELLGSTYNLLAILFIFKHDDLTAISYYLKSLEIAKKTNNIKLLGILYCNIGSIFSEYDPVYGLSPLLKGERYMKELINSTSLASEDESNLYNYEVLLCNISYSLVHSGKYQEALDKILDYLSLREGNIPKYLHIPFYYGKIMCYSKLGLIYDMQNTVKELISYLAENEIIAEHFKISCEMTREIIQSGLLTEAMTLMEQLSIIAKNESNETNSYMLSQLYILHDQKSGDNNALLQHYRNFYKYHVQKDIIQQQNHIKSIDNRIALEKELEIYKFYQEDTISLEKITESDSLTGLSNRYGLNKYYEHNFDDCKRKKEVFGLMIIDIDNFKIFNDTQGHLLGDSCIKQIAEVIKKCTSENYFCARYGGDEFFVVCRNIPYLEFQTTIASIVQTVRDTFRPTSGQNSNPITVSIGATLGIPSAAQTITDFISSADEALYHVKRASRNDYYINKMSIPK